MLLQYFLVINSPRKLRRGKSNSDAWTRPRVEAGATIFSIAALRPLAVGAACTQADRASITATEGVASTLTQTSSGTTIEEKKTSEGEWKEPVKANELVGSEQLPITVIKR